ncbi:MAG TPA: SMI1/KNR4 family protein [Bacteroidia bacterium]|jgi:hypothetical protein|nr:SMI1/KNR4 family protein [Bacteroidia bacterium]
MSSGITFMFNKTKKNQLMKADQQLSVKELINFWNKQNIPVVGISNEEIERVVSERSLFLPDDFKKFYCMVNGMSSFYPTKKMDAKGFLFYPVQAIVTANHVLENPFVLTHVIIFAAYQNKSWWYGIEVKDDGSYLIGLVSPTGKFKAITNSLAEFIEMYRKDAPKLYDYFEMYSSYEDYMMYTTEQKKEVKQKAKTKSILDEVMFFPS